MDLATARAALPGMTREKFGELVVIRPMKQGDMAMTVDPDRDVMEDVPARFDLVPALEQVGGGRERPEIVQAMGETATLTIERAKLLFELKQGDQIDRIDPVTGQLESYRIVRFGKAYWAIVLVYLSRI